MWDWSSIGKAALANRGGGGGGDTSQYGPYANGYQFDPNQASGGGSTDASANTGAFIKSAVSTADEAAQQGANLKAAYRRNMLDLVPQLVHTGSSIRPVSRYPGGAAMAQAAAAEREKASDAYATDKYSVLGKKIRQVNALGNSVGAGTGIVASLIRIFAGGGGGAGTGGANAGGMSI